MWSLTDRHGEWSLPPDFFGNHGIQAEAKNLPLQERRLNSKSYSVFQAHWSYLKKRIQEEINSSVFGKYRGWIRESERDIYAEANKGLSWAEIYVIFIFLFKHFFWNKYGVSFHLRLPQTWMLSLFQFFYSE